MSLSVAAWDGQPARGFTASFELRGSAQLGALEISGPLGTQALRADWSDPLYRLDTGQGPQAYGSLEELARVGLGEPLPLAALFDWLQGRPWPGAPYTSPDGHGARFEQLGWVLDAQALNEGALRATRQAQPTLTLRIRLDNPLPR